jgi:hypothetical protein
MGPLLVTCPITGMLLETGIETDEQSLTYAGDGMLRVFCQTCREHHPIKFSDGIVDSGYQLTWIAKNPQLPRR